MMKDIMQKLAELEATAPKVTKKKMLNEDSTTPPMNVSNKAASLKDMFEALSESIPSGAKPLPVLDPQNKQAGMGFVTSNNPAVQNMLKNLDPKDVQIVQAPGQSGQPQVGQQQQQQQTGQQQQQTGQPAPAGATGQPQQGQMQMKEKEAAGQKYEVRFANGKTQRFVAATPEEAKKKAKGLGAKSLIKITKDGLPKGKVEEKQLDELSPELMKRYARGRRDQLSNVAQAHDMRTTGQTNPKTSITKDKISGYYDAQAGDIGKARVAVGQQSTDAAGQAKSARMSQDLDSQAAFNAQRKHKALKGHDSLVKTVGKLRDTGAIKEGAKVDRMVKHIEKSERGLGKSKEKASDIAWATANKRGMLDNKNKKKVKEGDLPSSRGVDTMGAGLGAGRSAEFTEGKDEGKPGKNFAKIAKSAGERYGSKAAGERVAGAVRAKLAKQGKLEEAKPDFLDLDKDGNKKEPMKKAAADKNKKKVKESMNHRISAARLEGKSHGLRGHAHSGKRYEDLDEVRAYHEGYKEGLDECYGQGVYETAPAMPAATVGGMADQEMEEGKLGKAALALGGAAALATGAGIGKNVYDYHKKDASGYSQSDVDKITGTDSRMSAYDMDQRRQGNTFEDEFGEGNAFTAALAKTPKGGKFSVGGKTFTDRTGYDAKVNEYAFEAWDRELNDLLNESAEVNEGLSVSISKGQENSPDSVTITAQDAEAEHLLAFVKNAGLGLFGDDNADTHSSAMSVQPSHGAPDEVGAGGIDIGVVDGHDGMMGLMQKLSGIQSGGAEDYADEEGDEEQLYGNHEEAGKKDCGCDGDCECSDYDQPSNEETCNECGGMMEAGHSCGSKEVVDEVESEDQMEFEVAEDNAPDSDEAETSADEDAEAKEDAALAGADSGDEEEMNESDDEDFFHNPRVSADKQLKAPPKEIKVDENEDKKEDESVSESFANLFRKLAFIAEESTEKEDDKAEKAGKKVTKDIEHDDKEDKKGMSDKQAKFFGKKADKEKVDEWANNAGPGKTVSDTTFEQDIDFMTKVISGGLNKQKSTGQTTIPVIAGQEDRIHDESTNTPANFAKLAGIK